jgi:3-oxoacyl-[acyl-carrier protein] reductase
MSGSRRFKGRKAIVTGGASGIGLGVSARLALEGAQVAVWDMSEDALALAGDSIGASVTTIRIDIADPQGFCCSFEASPTPAMK